MMVFAGREGRWKYEDGTLELLLIPSKFVLFDALIDRLVCRSLCCSSLLNRH
jgi:hypothetical protein